MDSLEEKLRSFERFLDKISDSELDLLLSDIDGMNIKGPSVDEYLSSLNQSVNAFFDNSLDHLIKEAVNEQKERIELCKGNTLLTAEFDSLTNYSGVVFSEISTDTTVTVGESNYAMAA